uniref:Uncharacterized protein n=1 Tax=Anopheles epiroticus TaxID=199890 RepID=A0A182PFE2_9DIPT
MLSYMLPVEEKAPSAAAAAATRNLSLNLTATTTAAATGGAVSSGSAASVTVPRDTSAPGSGASSAAPSTSAQVRSIIKPTIKHGGGGSVASHRYQLIGSGGADTKLLSDSSAAGGGAGAGPAAGAGRSNRDRWQDEPEADQCDESTNLLAGGGADDEDEDEREGLEDERSRRRGTQRAGAVKSDKNFNNLIVVTNGRHAKPTNGNHAGPPAKLASVLKPTNGAGPTGRPGSSNGGAIAGNTGAYYNGYIAVSGDNDDEHHRLLVSANNLRNASVEPGQEWGPEEPAPTDPPRPVASTFSSTSRTNGNTCRTMNSLNGNLMGADPPSVAPLPLESVDGGGGEGGAAGGAADVSFGSDSDSATGAGGSGSTATGGGKKVKLNKLGGNKNVTLKR